MKETETLKKNLKRFSEIVVFLFVLTVFIFSLYKILTITRIISPLVYGATCGCEWCGECEGCGWCWSDPTPTSEPEPTATPTPGEESKPTPTPTPTSTPSDNGNGGDSGGSNGGPPGPPHCGAETPSAPTLLSVTKSGSEANLSWTAVDLATHYSILYGESSGSYPYGVDNTGQTTNFKIGGLNPILDYCFSVRAVNDCAPGGLSNEICSGGAVLGAGQVLGVSTLGATGDSEKQLLLGFYIIGSICLLLGIRMRLSEKASLFNKN